MAAAARLQALLPARNSESDLARLKAQVVQLGEAVRTAVPEAMWGQILAKILAAGWIGELARDDVGSGGPCPRL